MNSTATPLSLLPRTTGFDPALVVENERDDGTVRVRSDTAGPVSIISAHVAVPRTTPLTAGDRVLLAADSSREFYVIGRMGPFHSMSQSQTILRAANGACAVLSNSEKESEVLRVYSRKKELVFEYDPDGGKARVNIARGSLELSTEDGDIELHSAQNVRIGGRTIEMNSRQMNIKANSTRWVIDRMETMAGTLLEKAKNTYRTVEQLAQLRTGRMRTLVNQTFQFRSRRAFLRSEEDFKIRGEKIHLG